MSVNIIELKMFFATQSYFLTITIINMIENCSPPDKVDSQSEGSNSN